MKFSIRSFQFRRDLAQVDGDDVLHPVEVEPPEVPLERCDEVLDRRCGAVQVDEDPVVPGRHAHGHQPVLCAVEAFRRRARVAPAEVGGDVQRAVEPVGP